MMFLFLNKNLERNGNKFGVTNEKKQNVYQPWHTLTFDKRINLKQFLDAIK